MNLELTLKRFDVLSLIFLFKFSAWKFLAQNIGMGRERGESGGDMCVLVVRLELLLVG